jgi:hypothetical protein
LWPGSSKAIKKDQKTTTSVLYKISKMRKLRVKPSQPIKKMMPNKSPTAKK